MVDELRIETERPLAVSHAAPDSLRQWLADLASLRRLAQALYGDVAWSSLKNGDIIQAHKFVLYARAPGAFLHRYIEDAPRAPEPVRVHQGSDIRDLESMDFDELAERERIDVGTLEAALDYFYTAEREAEAFAVLLAGFKDGDDDAISVKATLAGWRRLQRDLMYCWRSQLYADATIVVECAPGTPFAVHRAVLAARTPYFRALLTGHYSDSNCTTFALPSPPFTPATTTFVLGWMYGGSLQSIERRFDLDTACGIWRCAAFLAADSLQKEVEEQLVAMMSSTRAARILAFARAADVRSEELAAKAMEYLVEHFDSSWAASSHVGQLSYADQSALVQRVGDRVNVGNLVATLIRLGACRRALPPHSTPWVEHVCAMLEGVEDSFVAVLKADLAHVVRTNAFLHLIDGVGFNNDILEWLLSLVIRGLDEEGAPRAYQVLLNNVLYREGGILANARLLISDALEGVASYIKRRLHAIQSAGGFVGLKPECVEELASALSVEVEVLRNRPSNDVDQVAARTRSAPRHLLEGEPNPIRPKRPTETRDEPSHPSSKNATTSPPPPRTAKPPSRRAAPVDSAIRRMPSRTSVVVPETGFIPHTRSRTSSSPTTSSARESIRRRRVSDQDVAEGAASTFSAGTRRANRSAFSSSSKPPLANSTRTKNEARRDLAVPGSTGSTLREGDSSQSGVCRPLSAQSPRSPLRAQTDASPGNLAGSVIGAGSGCTVLRSGVPCVVRVGDGNIPCNLRAEVRFIGPLPGAAGDWIGVEAYESDIPRDAANLPWSDGSRNGVSCFKLRSVEPAHSRLACASGAGQGCLDRRKDSRRSKPSDRSDFRSARTRALFIRPEQVNVISACA